MTRAPASRRRAAIVTPVIRARDAVGTDTIEMARALRDAGWDVAVFGDSARGVNERVAASHRALAHARAREDLLVYHFSFGWPGAPALLREARCTRVVKYHNVTPPEFFAPYSPAHVRACEDGRRAIAELVALGCERYLADSSYNLGELLNAGLPAGRGAVLPPFSRIERLVATPADLHTLDRWGTRAARQFLMVGRIAPNKGHVALVDGFARYRTETGEDARLLIVGIQDSRLLGYRAEIDSRITRHRLRDAVVFLEDADERQLKAAYLCADALVMPSEHEGFCVPVVEAMALGVPVVAHHGTALPETVGGGGLLVDARDPASLADAMRRITTDEALRRRSTAAGRSRCASYFASRAVAALMHAELARAA